MLHARAFKVSVVWTLLLLYLGSVVHATESSLACPDWPTCFGTMLPEMTGGVFWEHLHRLVAGGLVLMFMLATWLAYKETSARPWIFSASLFGMTLLIVQSVFGGLTVIYELPDLISTTHLSLALLFLALATLLASSTIVIADSYPAPSGFRVRAWAMVLAGFVFVQSVLGGLVRHMDAGMACPDVPLCLGQILPPLVNAPITIHFFHRLLAILLAAAVLWFAHRVYWKETWLPIRRWAKIVAILVVLQVTLGFVSVLTLLAVIPVSLHTLLAACLLASLIHMATIFPRSSAATPGVLAPPTN